MGYQKVYIKTINGFFDFDMRRYKTDAGLKAWLELTQVYSLGSGYETPLLQAYYLEWSKYLSYEKISDLLKTRVCNGRLSDQHIFNKVASYAAEIAASQSSQIKSREDTQSSEIIGELVDIYEENSK